jgi:hypothetical protein
MTMKDREAFTRDLQQLADESAFSTADWQAAVAAMRAWLTANQLTISDKGLLQYIACCAEGQATTAAHTTLEDTTRDYLEAYGCATAVSQAEAD